MAANRTHILNTNDFGSSFMSIPKQYIDPPVNVELYVLNHLRSVLAHRAKDDVWSKKFSEEADRYYRMMNNEERYIIRDSRVEF